MQNLNRQMIINAIAVALTSTFSSWLSWLAAWSHFSAADNTILAGMIATLVATVIGTGGTVLLNRMPWLQDAVAQGDTRVVLPTQAAADAIQNPNVVGPEQVKVTK